MNTDDFFTPDAPGRVDETPPPFGFKETNLQPREAFTIQTREHCDWYMKKVAALNAEEALITAQAEKMLARVRSDRESLQGRYQGQLESFVRGELERTKSKKRSIVFFHGTAQFTSVAPRLVIESEADALTTAAMLLPAALVEVPATVKLDKKALLSYAAQKFEETGELIPGVGRTEASERFAIKFPTEQQGGTSNHDE